VTFQLERSKNIHTHMRNSWDFENAPRYMITHDSSTEVRLSNRAKIFPLTASQKTVRGPHPQFVLLDEIDEMSLEILEAALGQTFDKPNYLGEMIDGYTVMCSTWQNPDGTFSEIKRRAEDQDFPVYAWCYREAANPVDGWLTQKAIDSKKASIPKHMWESEYELNDPAVENVAFDRELVVSTFSLPFEPIESKTKKNFEVYTFAKQERDGTYVAGADWAKEQDYTVIAVSRIDVTPHQLVYYARFNRLPYPIMIDYFNKAINDYNAYPIHDGTGLGNVIQDHLDERARPFLMVGEKRHRMLSEYVNAVESGKWRFPKIPSAFREHRDCRVGDLYKNGGTENFHLPDTVCAFALMEYQARRFAPYIGPDVLKKDPAYVNKYQKMFEPNAKFIEGEVRQMTEMPTNWDLTV
jgi:hypothetical protein